MTRRRSSSSVDHAFPRGVAGWILALLFVLSSGGCASMDSAAPPGSPAAEAKPDREAAVEPPPTRTAPRKRVATAPKSAEAQDAPAPQVAAKAGESEPMARPAPALATPPANEKAANSAAKSPAKVAASPAPKEAPGKKTAAAPAPDKPAAPPTLDLDSLEKRLKETNAIGVFTKLTLKNQVDELLERFKAFYAGRTKTTLAELRQPYDLLILKVLTLLQDGDPSLAGAIRSSREAIWGILSDPVKFSKLAS